ncbi:MAG TPA: MarR family transcriptional regulator [Lachnospiraceae bacterium]|nr:MarR family transcriptional regulator [Lachnospiraceae bacterium]
MKNKKELSQTIDPIPTDELLKLDNQLCFAFYVCSKEIIKKYKPLLDPLGLTYTSYITLLALWEEDNINVKDLGKRLYLDSGTLTPILKKMEHAGLVQRKRSDTDERNVYILLTEKGRTLKVEAANVPKQLLCSIPFGSEDDLSISKLLPTLHLLMGSLTNS